MLLDYTHVITESRTDLASKNSSIVMHGHLSVPLPGKGKHSS